MVKEDCDHIIIQSTVSPHRCKVDVVSISPNTQYAKYAKTLGNKQICNYQYTKCILKFIAPQNNAFILAVHVTCFVHSVV